jgi:hypothetical protein
MKHQRDFKTASDTALREAAQISALISDLDRAVRMINQDIAAEEERARVSDHSNPAHPIFARMLTARRANLKETIASLERLLASFVDRTEQAVPA